MTPVTRQNDTLFEVVPLPIPLGVVNPPSEMYVTFWIEMPESLGVSWVNEEQCSGAEGASEGTPKLVVKRLRKAKVVNNIVASSR